VVWGSPPQDVIKLQSLLLTLSFIAHLWLNRQAAD